MHTSTHTHTHTHTPIHIAVDLCAIPVCKHCCTQPQQHMHPTRVKPDSICEGASDCVKVGPSRPNTHLPCVPSISVDGSTPAHCSHCGTHSVGQNTMHNLHCTTLQTAMPLTVHTLFSVADCCLPSQLVGSPAAGTVPYTMSTATFRNGQICCTCISI